VRTRRTSGTKAYSGCAKTEYKKEHGDKALRPSLPDSRTRQG
jgi:hypothetical protein